AGRPRQGGPGRVEATAEQDDASVPHQPRLAIDAGHDAGIALGPFESVPPIHLHAADHGEIRAREGARWTRRREVPADPTSRARAGALPGGCTRATRGAALAPGVPETAIVSPPSPAPAAAMPRLAGTRAGGASTSSATPGTSTLPAPSAVRCRSLSTCTSRAGRGSAATRRAAPPTAGTRSR